MIDPVDQLVVLIYQYLLNEHDRRYESYYQRIDYFCRRLYYSKPEKTFVNNDFLDLIVLYVGLTTYDEIYRDIWAIVQTYSDSYKKFQDGD